MNVSWLKCNNPNRQHPKFETKAQRIERLKRSKNAWDHFDEIQQFARTGFDSIPPEWLGTYFRSWGVYTQGDGVGVIGGKNGEGKAMPFFMVRIRIPNGLMRSEQVRTIANLAEKYGRGVADITVRQNIQLHWVTIESLPDVLQSLWNVGLTTTGACGDVARNITGCPLAGLDGEEIIDASPLALQIDRELGGNSEFYNLPRKFKISITGCRHWCSYPEINDIGLTATTRRRAGKSEVGFTLRVGGGLSTNPHLAVALNAFIKPEQVIPVVRGVAEIFRASEVLRQSREKARLKFLFLEHGWTADTFLAELQQRIGFSLDPGEREEIPADIHRDHVGVHDQKQPGLVYVGASVLRGRITPQQLNLAADLADRYADGHVRNTVMQNLLDRECPQRERLAGRRRAYRRGPARSGFGLRTRHHILHRFGILQTRSHRNEKFRPLAHARTRRAPSRFRRTAQAAHHRLPQQLRPALDRRYRHRR